MTDSDIAAFIRTHLPVHAVPGIPEVRLHKAVPASGLGRLAAADEEGFGSPYWAHHWAGGLALARYLLDHPEAVAGRRVLDLGAGSGLVAITAMLAGAERALAGEVDAYAVAALRLNAALNGVAVEVVQGDLTTGDPPDVEVVLVGDLFYEAALAGRVTGFLERCAAHGIRTLIGDPWRARLPVARLREIARYEVRETGRPKASGVFAFVG